jgi:hypothetical protein
MSTLQCPQCQQIVSAEDRFCRTCGARLPQLAVDSPSAGAAKPDQSPQPASTPPASAPAPAAPSAGGLVWRKHVDAWNGFSLERPSGWDVRTTHDTITVCYDLQGLTNAAIRPIQLQQSVTADDLSGRLVEMMRSNSTNLTAWRMNPGEKTYAAMHRRADQVLLRFRCTEDNQELIGVLSVMVEGNKGRKNYYLFRLADEDPSISTNHFLREGKR